MLLLSIYFILILFFIFKLSSDRKKSTQKELFLNLQLSTLTKNLEDALQKNSNLNQDYCDFINQSNIKDEKIESLKNTVALVSSNMERMKV